MAELIDLRDSLLEALGEGSEFEKYVQEEIRNRTKEQYTNLDLIIFSLKTLIDRIEITRTKNLFFNKTSYSFTINEQISTNFNGKKLEFNEKELMIYGAKVIFAIREFLNQEKLYFGLNITTLTGRTTAKVVSQDEVIPKLVAVEENAIGLTNKLERVLMNSDKNKDLDENKLMESSILEIWKNILKLSKSDYTSKDETNKKIKEHPAYPKHGPDQNVYIIFSGAKNNISKYYKTDGNNYFNDGWLWQWTLQLAYSEKNGIEELKNSVVDKNSLAIFFDGKNTFRRDNELGTRQGDLYSSLSEMQIQAKMNNNVIIRFNTILEIADELYTSLINYKNNTQSKELRENFLNIANKYLMPSVSTVNQEANNIIGNLLKELPGKT